MKKWLFGIALLVLAFVFIIKPISVNGRSMEPSLDNNDFLIVNKLAYKLGEPKRGDIVVFPHEQGSGEDKLYVKRVIAVHGDHLEIKDGSVYINGEILEEKYLREGCITEGKVSYIIPKGEIFVMGDNRENSSDSRDFGTVAIDKAIGKVLIRIYPFNKIGTV